MRTDKLKVVHILEVVRRIIRSWPSGVRRELGTVLLRLQRNEYVGMPDMKACRRFKREYLKFASNTKKGRFEPFMYVQKKTQS